MIKLKELLLENGYVGNVEHNGSITAYQVVDPASEQHPDWGIGHGDRWKYYKKYNEVIWTDEPHSMDSIYFVNNWLLKHGIYKLPNHYFNNEKLWASDEI